MRMSATKLLGTLAIGGVMLASTACAPLDALTGGGKKAACDNIRTELSSVTSKISSPSLNNLQSSSAANAQLYRDTAAKIRTEGEKAGGDVETAAGKVATDLEGLATTLGSIGSGNAPSTTGSGNFIQNAAELGRACGYSG